jgi:hypothetical protein
MANRPANCAACNTPIALAATVCRGCYLLAVRTNGAVDTGDLRAWAAEQAAKKAGE